MAFHNDPPRVLQFPKRVTKEQKLLYVVIVIQIVGFLALYFKH